MAHGAGGKATQTLVEGLFVPAFGSEALRELDDAGVVGDLARDHRQLRGQADQLPRRLDRRAGRQRHGQRPRGLWGARPLALTLSLVLEEGLPADDLRAEVEAIAAAAEAAGVEVVAGDTKVVERGKCDSMYVTTTGIGRLDDRGGAVAGLAPAGRSHPRLGPGREARDSGHAGPRRVRARRRGRVGHMLALAGRRRTARRGGPGPALPA